jgi:HEAT repeat protein
MTEIILEDCSMSENFETLIQHLNDDDDNVRSRAAVDLGKSGDPRAIEPLLSTLLNDNNRYVREYAAEALDKLHWQPPGGEISAAYFVAKRKFNSCVEIGPPAVNALIRELNAEAGFRRKEAIRALGKIGGLAATEAIKQLITDGSVGEFAQDTLKKMVNTETSLKRCSKMMPVACKARLRSRNLKTYYQHGLNLDMIHLFT